jgi:mannose-6-phosphate isomerase-like protein (cupin superfamily)
MTQRHRLVVRATPIPAPGGKRIEEFFGRVSTGTEAFSLAHMVAPAGWAEPAQRPTFGELTLVLRGRMRVEVGDDTEPEVVVVEAGQAFWVEPNVRVRYSNPFPEESEYYAWCLPAFDVDAARREPA